MDRAWRSDRASPSINPVAIPFDPATTARRRAVRARHAKQHPRPERRVAGRKADRVFQHRRSSGGHLHRLAGRADAARHRRCAARPRAGVHARRALARLLFESRRQLGRCGWSAWTAAICARSPATASGAVYVQCLAEGRHGYLRRQTRVGRCSRRRSRQPAGASPTPLRGTTAERQVLQPDRMVAGRRAPGRHTHVGQRPPVRHRHLRSRRADHDGASPRTRRLR